MSAEYAALGGAFATGLGSSLGPCVAPRYLIVSACAGGEGARRNVAAFIAGTIGGYFVYALGGGLLALLRAGSHAVYLAIAACLTIGGVATLANVRARCCGGSPQARSGGMFAIGVASALTFSPCCTPVALALGMQASLGPDPLVASGALVAFGIGHAVPVAGMACGIARIRFRLRQLALREEADVVRAAILLGVAALYGVLA